MNAHLELHNTITWIDHHQAGSPPENPCLKLHIDQKPGTCSRNTVSLLQKGKHFKWATVGVVGDNLSKLGGNLEKEAGCCEKEKERLKELGKHINYNAYGESIEDLHFSPSMIYQEVKNFIDPLIFINRLNYLKA